MDLLDLHPGVGLDGRGIGAGIIENLHLGIGGRQLPAGMGAEIPEHELLLGGLRIEGRSGGEVGHGKTELLAGLDPPEPPAEGGDPIQQPALFRLLYKICFDTRPVMEAE